MKLSKGRVEHGHVHQEGHHVGKPESAVPFENHPAPDADDGDRAQIGDKGGARTVGGPAEHGPQGSEAQELGLFIEALALALLQGKGLDETVSLDVFNQQAVQVASRFTDPLPDLSGAL